MAFGEKPTSEHDLSSGHESNVELDIHEGDYCIRLVPEKPDRSGTSAWFIPAIDSHLLIATNTMVWVLWSLYLWYEICVVRHTQEIAGQILWCLWFTVAGDLGVLISDSFVSFEVVLSFLFEKKKRTHRYRLLRKSSPIRRHCNSLLWGGP